MITAFSQGDVNDINQVLSDENFTREELYIVCNALEDYYYKKLNQDEINKCEQIQSIIGKIQNLIKVDLKNE